MEPNQTQQVPTPPVVETAVGGRRSKPSKLPLILTLFLAIILLFACGALGYLYKTTTDRLTAEVNHYKMVLESAQTELKKKEAAEKFIAEYNTAALSRQSCNGSSLLMSDVHANDKFIVYRYLCADKSSPILIGAFAKHKDGSTDFTYGSSVTAPNKLPGYIYDSEPDFFGPIYKTTRL